MKHKFFYASLLAIAFVSSIYLISCQKDTPPKVEVMEQATPDLNGVEDRSNLFCTVRFQVISGEELTVCGFGSSGVCAVDCSGNKLVGSGTIYNTYSVSTFPKRFAVRNNGTYPASVNINWSCGPAFCGGTLPSGTIPVGGVKHYIISNNGSTCSCLENLCE